MATEASSTNTTFASPCKKERDVTVEALNHLIQGKRHLLVQDIPSAIGSLQEACSLLSACYGELANECGDAYYYYGLALLEMSRRESGVLANGKDGSASEGDDTDDDDEEEEDEEEKDSTEDDSKSSAIVGQKDEKKGQGDASLAKASDESKPSAKPEMTRENGVAKRKDDSEAKSEDLEDSKKADEGDVKVNSNTAATDSKENDKSSVAAKDSFPATSSSSSGGSTPAPTIVTPSAPGGSSAGPSCSSGPSPSTGPSSSSAAASSSSDPAQPSTSQGVTKESDEEEDISNLQLAWEVLELSKVIFKRQAEGSQEMQLKLANVYSKLGEVAMESENYDQSVEDLLECLDIQRLVLSADNRNIAETYYQLGLAYSFSMQFDMSIGNFKNAINIIEQRIASLEKVLGGKEPTDKPTDEDPIAVAEEEIKELKALVPEIKEKILDTEDLKKNSIKLPEALNQELEPESTRPGASLIADATSSSPLKEQRPVTNIGHLVRKKRKPEEDEAPIDSSKDGKRLREENAFSAAMAASTEVVCDTKRKSS